jgi:hypothetical protein
LLTGVLGFPVAHSRSPAMMNAAFAALGLDWRYVKLPVPPERFDETARALPASGYRGANVTIPHKLSALELADERSEAAAAIGAANTLTFLDGTIVADNTDAGGLLIWERWWDTRDERAWHLALMIQEMAQSVIRREQLAELFSRAHRIPGVWDVHTECFRPSTMACLFQSGYEEWNEHWTEAPPLPSVNRASSTVVSPVRAPMTARTAT